MNFQTPSSLPSSSPIRHGRVRVNNVYQLSRLLVLTFAIIIGFCNSGCKYEEGPIVSFIKAKYRVTGNYRIEKFYVNDIDTTAYYNALMCNTAFSFEIGNETGEGIIDPFIPTLTFNPNCPGGFRAYWDLCDHNCCMKIWFFYGIPVLGPWGQFDSFTWDLIKLTDKEMILGGKSFETTYRIELKKI